MRNREISTWYAIEIDDQSLVLCQNTPRDPNLHGEDGNIIFV